MHISFEEKVEQFINILEKENTFDKIALRNINNDVKFLKLRPKHSLNTHIFVLTNSKGNKLNIKGKYRKFKVDINDKEKSLFKLYKYINFSYSAADDYDLQRKYMKDKMFFNIEIFKKNIEKDLREYAKYIDDVMVSKYVKSLMSHVFKTKYLPYEEIVIIYNLDETPNNKFDIKILNIEDRKLNNFDIEFIKVLFNYVVEYTKYYNKFKIHGLI